ncbi:hypothetical protein HPDFL43_17151 [Hoeflea phototrophica DFL-43]|uniref:Uncharacterized protein n=1 Tax=Hoeflea phototrophica (strain DSM 17068 / NCIMB 14078 / DFL-43) TaxID=411684 RepID=A9D852_HOEPD|nr:hypothetical protein HPDFL43_17151 [Hoeflea phototrophica DFL-43]
MKPLQLGLMLDKQTRLVNLMSYIRLEGNKD